MTGLAAEARRGRCLAVAEEVRRSDSVGGVGCEAAVAQVHDRLAARSARSYLGFPFGLALTLLAGFALVAGFALLAALALAFGLA